MSIPQPPIEAENYARGLDVIITEAEHQVINEVQATIDVLMQSLEAEAEGEISDERLEQLTAALNRQLENLLACAMFTLQAPLSRHALTVGPVRNPAPLQPPDTLLRRATMDGESIAVWFRRFSPSRWQKGLIDLIRGGLTEYLQQTVNTVRQCVTRLANTVVETSL